MLHTLQLSVSSGFFWLVLIPVLAVITQNLALKKSKVIKKHHHVTSKHYTDQLRSQHNQQLSILNKAQLARSSHMTQIKI